MATSSLPASDVICTLTDPNVLGSHGLDWITLMASQYNGATCMSGILHTLVGRAKFLPIKYLWGMATEEHEASWDLRRKAYLKRRTLRERSVDYKGGKCEICSYDTCLSALEFHHPNPAVKEFNISDRVTTFEDIQAELDKCHLLCANCHREVHEGLHPSYLVLDGDFPGAYLDVPDDGLSYTEEMELEAVLGLAEQALEESTEPPLRTERNRRNIRHDRSLCRSQPRSH